MLNYYKRISSYFCPVELDGMLRSIYIIMTRWSWEGYTVDIRAGTNPVGTAFMSLDTKRLPRGPTVFTISQCAVWKTKQLFLSPL